MSIKQFDILYIDLDPTRGREKTEDTTMFGCK